MIAFVTGLADDSQSIRCAVQSLITLGIPFSGWAEQKLSREIPENLDSCEALIIDETRLRNLTGPERIRLEQYVRHHALHIIPERYSSLHVTDCELNSETDINIFAAASGTARPGMPKLSTEQILKGYVRMMEEYVNVPHPPELYEYDLHCMESLLESEKAGILPEEWSGRITAMFEEWEQYVQLPIDIDRIAAWKFASVAAERCGNRRLLDKILKAADTAVSGWARSDLGLLSLCGRPDDPLCLSHPDYPAFGKTRGTIGLRNLHLNEQLHYFGAAFPPLTAITGDSRFLDETLALMRHIDTVHRDPADGLLHHASRNGKPVGQKWGRGITHALMGVFYLLKENPGLPEEIRQSALRFLDRTGSGLRNHQTANGMWRNIIDREDSPEETSCTVLITWIYSYGLNHGWFSRERYAEMVMRSGSALKSRFWRGCGSGNCRGSFPSPDLGYYLRRPLHMYMMPLIAPALLESDRILNAPRSCDPLRDDGDCR